jgi:FAD/FMN-containing dehydrogenase
MTAAAVRAQAEATLAETMAAIVGAPNVLAGDEDRAFFGTDIAHTGVPPDAVVLPGTIDELQAVVRACHDNGVPLTVRGGGASYTRGYLHSAPGGITIATDRLTRIQIDENNHLVTVEPGVTWAALWEALKARGLRTRFWGSFSGLKATVGGSISQNSISHGPGISAESVVALDVVTGTGELLRTGSGAHAAGVPFLRNSGPDLTGLFCGDCGALGVKARISFALTRRHEAFAALSFSFTSFEALHAAMQAAALESADDGNFGLDATLQQGQIGRNEGAAAKASIAKGVLKSAGSFSKGVSQLAKLAVAGDRALRAASYVAHYICDGPDQASADAKAAVIRRAAAPHGQEIANSVPTVVRAMPFAPFTNILGPHGERWAPLHGLLPHECVVPLHHAISALWDEHRAEMGLNGVYTGAMFMAVGPTAFVYEPAFYWPGERTIVHERMVPAEHLATLQRHASAEGSAALVERLKGEVIALMHEHGAAHLQLGKLYPYLAGRNPASVVLLRAIKRELDPRGILNPGALGL